MSTFSGPFPGGGAWVTGGKVDIGRTGGVTEGAGAWLPGMRWESWGQIGDAGTDSAMRLSAVFACLRLLSEAISTLPLDTFRREAGTRRPYRPMPAYLDFQPPAQSRIVYLSQVMLSLLTDGNAFVATPRDELGVPTALVPLDPTAVAVKRDGGQIVYVAGNEVYSPAEIMHIPGMTLPGELRGVSPLRAAREVIESGRRAQEFGTKFLANSAMPPGVIEVPEGGPPAEQRERAKRIAQALSLIHI